MSVIISSEIFTKFPATTVAVALVRGAVTSSKKGAVKEFLSEYKQEVVKQLVSENVTSKNYHELPVCKSWDGVYESFQEGDKKSTIHNLLRRASSEGDKMTEAKEKNAKPYRANMGQITDVVDLYNCVSIETKTPMGALLNSAIDGDIVLRFGHGDEQFTSLGKTEQTFAVTANHIVYADNKSILTWLWNFKDAKHASVPSKSDGEIDVLIFADQAESEAGDAVRAIEVLQSKINAIGWKCIQTAILNSENPRMEINK